MPILSTIKKITIINCTAKEGMKDNQSLALFEHRKIKYFIDLLSCILFSSERRKAKKAQQEASMEELRVCIVIKIFSFVNSLIRSPVLQTRPSNKIPVGREECGIKHDRLCTNFIIVVVVTQTGIPDKRDAAAVQQFFMEEIQKGEELLALGLCPTNEDCKIGD